MTGRERHSHARADDVGYPARAIRTHEYLYILNLKPDRWPAGDPVPEGSPIWPGYHDIDNGPTKSFILDHKSSFPVHFALGYEKRPEEQLYNIGTDPGCIKNLSNDPAYQSIKTDLKKQLLKELKKQGDPRIKGTGDIFDSYPRFGAMRDLEGFREQGKYNPAFMKRK